jgi:superfamily II DNA/RNA helicase
MLRSGVPVGVLHGGKSQGQRTRVLKAFKDGRASALVATDVAARGIHVDDVSLVVHVDAPADHKDYLHRAGRTARAGATGTVVTLATHKQKKAVFGITNRAAVKLIENQVRPGDSKLQEITGAQEPSGIPIEVEAEKTSRNDRKPGSRSRSNDRGNRDGNFKPRKSGGGRFESAPKVETAESREERAFQPAREERRPSADRSFSADRRPKVERTDRPYRSAPKKWEEKARESRTREESATPAGNRGRVESSAPGRPAKKAPRMPLEKRIALEKAESRARSGKPGAPKKFGKTGGKPFKAGKPSQAKRG